MACAVLAGLATIAAVVLYFVGPSTTTTVQTDKNPLEPDGTHDQIHTQAWMRQWSAAGTVADMTTPVVSWYANSRTLTSSVTPQYATTDSEPHAFGQDASSRSEADFACVHDPANCQPSNHDTPVASQNPPIPGLWTYSSTGLGGLPPAGLGFSVFTDVPYGKDAAQLLSSLPNQYVSFLQIDRQVQTNDSVQFTVHPVDGQKNPANAPLDPLETKPSGCTDLTASSIGSYGVRVLAVSQDGLRLYVGYQTALERLTTTKDGCAPVISPLGVRYGRVAVFTRASTVATDWTFSASGTQTSPLGRHQDDRFGAYLDTAIQTVKTGFWRWWATTCRVALDGASPSIFVYREDTGSTVTRLDGWLRLPPSVASHQDLGERGLALGAGHCVASGAANSSRVYHYVRSLTTGLWEYSELLGPPSGSTQFGTSLALHHDARTLIVGSVGAVYVYTRKGHDLKFTLATTLSPPTTSRATFGQYVRTDSLFRVLLVSDRDGEAGTKPVLHVGLWDNQALTLGTFPRATLTTSVPYGTGSNQSVWATRTAAVTRVEGATTHNLLVSVGYPDQSPGGLLELYRSAVGSSEAS